VADSDSIPFRIVGAEDLEKEMAAVLRPGALVPDENGRQRRLPRYFYEVPSWDAALETQLTPHFGLWELLDVDFREAEAIRSFPRYVPCAVTLLASVLELFRDRVGSVVRIAANGGYRSPGHALNHTASPHCWASAANIYRIGSEMMDSRDKIEKYSRIARETLPGIWTRPFGGAPGQAFDHVHLDLGYVTVAPHDAPDEEKG
jgi:hypothetical protein